MSASNRVPIEFGERQTWKANVNIRNIRKHEGVQRCPFDLLFSSICYLHLITTTNQITVLLRACCRAHWRERERESSRSNGALHLVFSSHMNMRTREWKWNLNGSRLRFSVAFQWRFSEVSVVSTSNGKRADSHLRQTTVSLIMRLSWSSTRRIAVNHNMRFVPTIWSLRAMSHCGPCYLWATSCGFPLWKFEPENLTKNSIDLSG